MRIVVGKLTFGVLALYMTLQNLHIRSNEYEVYLGSLQGRYSAETLEGVRSSSMMGCHMISIVHLEGIGDHGLIGLVGLLNVEVHSYHS